jgi:hypothetical protein
VEECKIFQTGNLKILVSCDVKRRKRQKVMKCESANAMQKCEKNSHRIAPLNKFKKRGKLIDRSFAIGFALHYQPCIIQPRKDALWRVQLAADLLW